MKRPVLVHALAVAVSVSALAAERPALKVEKPAPPADLKQPPDDAERRAGGLVVKRLEKGSGAVNPTESDFVRIRYTVWQASTGDVVNFTRPGSATFVQMSKLLPGMRQMILHMVIGEKSRGWIPPELGGGKIAADDTWVVDAEIVEVIPPPTPPPDVAAPPADASVTRSGLAYKVLRSGTSEKKPKRSSRVVVHYSGWTTDGMMFDSSVTRDDPAEFSLDEVIPGWTEGMQLMRVGEKTRFWIPGKLAYGREPGKPKGMLVFDIELIEVK